MRFVNELTEHLLKSNDSLVLESVGLYVHFLINNEGNAKFIYACMGYSEDFHLSTCREYKMAAVYSEDVFYIVDTFIFNYYNCTSDANVMLLANKMGEYRKYITENIFPAFYDSLAIDKITEDDKKNYRLKARNILLSGEPMVPAVGIDEDILEMSDVLKILCGHTTLENIAESALNNDEGYYKAEKREFEILTELISDSKTAEPWELAIAEGLRNVTDNHMTAKYVTVEFEINNKKATGKVSPAVLVRKLANNDYFCDWDFSTAVSGEKLLNELGMAHSRFSNDELLRCKHISKITYSRKVLYQKED